MELSNEQTTVVCERCGAPMLLRSMAPVRAGGGAPRPILRLHYQCRQCAHETDVIPSREHIAKE